MKREILVIRPEKHKRRVGVLPTYSQRDRTKYTRKAKHRGQNGSREQQGKPFAGFPCCSFKTRRISSEGRAIVS